jgi:hypothetical protein
LTPAELRSLGEKFYGPRWKHELAEKMFVTPRCVRYWATGECKIHPVFALRIRELGAERAPLPAQER